MTDLTDREQLVQLATKMDFVVETVTTTKEDVKALDKKIDTVTGTMESKLRKDMVTKDEFEPVKRIVYGGVGIILTIVAGAIVMLVVNGAMITP